MRFSEKWLRQWVDPPVTAHELGNALTMAGFEVEELKEVRPGFKGVVIAEILDVKKHPDADKLNICTVSIGPVPNSKEQRQLTIVCGAKNVRPKLKAPLAMVGAKVANGIEISRAVLRGVTSEGMLCSEKELGLKKDSQGLMELSEDAPLGTDLAEYLDLHDNEIELNVTPNRGDVLSIAGIAREVGAIFNLPLCMPAIPKTKPKLDDVLAVKILAKESCPLYLGCVIKGIDVTHQTPHWIVDKLLKSNIATVNIIVDIVNYVMLEFGQPMHAFDLEKIDEKVEIRFSKVDEKIALLNGEKITLDDETLIIADKNKVLAVAGIMGGMDSAISNNTKTIFLESAFFSPSLISKTSKKYSLHSDSSHRFERGVDFAGAKAALVRAIQLILNLAGGEYASIIDQSYSEYLPQRKTIFLELGKIEKVLGLKIERAKIISILKSLGIDSKIKGQTISCLPPTWRYDVNIDIDIVEEISRIYGYDKLPSATPKLHLPDFGSLPMVLHNNKKRLKLLLADLGYQEIVTYSFIDEKLCKMFSSCVEPLRLLNPIAADLNAMRTSLWPGLINTFLYNKHRRTKDFKLFEVGLIFLDDPQQELQQKLMLGGLLAGSFFGLGWGNLKSSTNDYFFIKKDLEKIYQTFNLSKELVFKKEQHEALHPGYAARIYLHSKPCGWLGKLHPILQTELDVNEDIYLFTLELDFLHQTPDIKFNAVAKFPPVERDIAIIIKENISWEEIRKKIFSACPEFLQDIELFDIYNGANIELGYRSLAIRLTWQNFTQTFTDNDIEKLLVKVIKILETDFAAKLRG